MKLFGEGGWGVAQDKGGLLVGGQGAPIRLAGVIENGCEEFDQIHHDMRCCRAICLYISLSEASLSVATMRKPLIFNMLYT